MGVNTGRASTLFALTILWFSSCVPRSGGGEKFYVVIRPEETKQFLDSVISVAKEMGLHSNVGRIVDGNGDVLNVIEAEGQGVRLWVQNVLLSGREDSNLCGLHKSVHQDPAQFIIYAKPTWSTFHPERAAKVEEDVLLKLRTLGYKVKRNQALCGQAELSK